MSHAESPLPLATLAWQDRDRHWVLTVVCKATFDLLPEVARMAVAHEPLVRSDAFWDDDPRRSLLAASDVVPTKASVDVLVVGHAHPPAGRFVSSMVARLTVGSIDKRVEVHPDRVRQRDGSITRSGELEPMPLLWERTVGGPGTDNPVGMRRDAEDAFGCLPMPNLVAPGTPFGELGRPVGFGPIARSWPGRASRLGEDAWPDHTHERPMPAAFDASFFNVAPPDQQIAHLPEMVTIGLENLMRDHPRFATRLPALAPSAMVDVDPPRRLALRADTLVIDVDRAIATLVWRGEMPIADPQEVRGVVLTDLDPSAKTQELKHLGALLAAQSGAGSSPLPFSTGGAGPRGEGAARSDAATPFGGASSPPVTPVPADGVFQTLVARRIGSPGEAPDPPKRPSFGAPPAAPQAPPAPLAAAPWRGAAPWPAPVAPLAPAAVPQHVASAALAGVAEARISAPPPVERIDTWKLHEQAAARRSPEEPTAAPEGAARAEAAPSAVSAARAPDRDLPVEVAWVGSPGEVDLAGRSTVLRAQLDDEEDDWMSFAEGAGGSVERARHDVARWFRSARPLKLDRLNDTMIDALRAQPEARPFVVVAGELTWSFDPRESLRAWIALGTPLAADPRIKEAIEHAERSMQESVVAIPEVLHAALERLRDVVRPIAKLSGTSTLDAAAERYLVEGRGFARRRVWGQNRLRAHLSERGGRLPVAVYLDEDAGWQAPLCQRFSARLLGELRTRQDPTESAAVCIRCVAFGVELAP